MLARLLQLGDSALPIGGYSQSWGLEAALDRGLVVNPITLEDWVRGWLRHAVAPGEGVVAAHACRAGRASDWAGVAEANRMLAASLVPPTLRNASREMGQQLLGLARGWAWAAPAVAGLPPAEWHHAAVFGALAGVAGADPETALLVYLHQAALGSISAGVRAVPIGHTHGQQVLARLHEDIEALARTFSVTELQTVGSFSPAHEVLCDAQTQLYTRLFRS